MAGPSSPTQSACGLTLPGGLSGGYSQPAEPPGRRPFALGLGWPRGVGEGRRAGEGRLALLPPALAFRRGRTDGRVRGLGLRTPDKGLLFSGLHFHRLAKPQRQEEKVRRDLQIPRACKGEHGEPQPYRGWRLAPGPIQPCLGRRSPARGGQHHPATEPEPPAGWRRAFPKAAAAYEGITGPWDVRLEGNLRPPSPPSWKFMCGKLRPRGRL